VYRAETDVPSSPLPGLAACATFMDRVVGTLWWQSRFPDRTLDRVPYLRPGYGARQAFLREEDDGGHSIALPLRYRTKGVVLHELVHWALHDQADLPAHGQTFTRVLLDSVDEYLGPDRAEALERAFDEHRVRVGAPAACAVDGRLAYGADERLRLQGVRSRAPR
jgi:putative metallohydrolase (TIGR04338 family)